MNFLLSKFSIALFKALGLELYDSSIRKNSLIFFTFLISPLPESGFKFSKFLENFFKSKSNVSNTVNIIEILISQLLKLLFFQD